MRRYPFFVMTTSDSFSSSCGRSVSSVAAGTLSPGNCWERWFWGRGPGLPAVLSFFADDGGWLAGACFCCRRGLAQLVCCGLCWRWSLLTGVFVDCLLVAPSDDRDRLFLVAGAEEWLDFVAPESERTCGNVVTSTSSTNFSCSYCR